MNERDFLKLLEDRAKEQESLIRRMPFQSLFTATSLWLGEHPWRLLIPLAFLLTLAFRLIFGLAYYELVLKIFGGFGILLN